MDIKKEFWLTIAMGFVGFMVLCMLTSCGTTSLMKCDSYIGIEKEECVKDIIDMQYSATRSRAIKGY